MGKPRATTKTKPATIPVPDDLMELVAPYMELANTFQQKVNEQQTIMSSILAAGFDGFADKTYGFNGEEFYLIEVGEAQD